MELEIRMINDKRASKRRSAGTSGIKALIAACSVAATIAGWALLPSNDPQATSAAGPLDTGQTTLSAPVVPGNGDTSNSSESNGAPDIQQNTPNSSLPQITTPRGSIRRPGGFTNTHSSR